MNKIAIPAILLFVATNLQYAEAGPLAYASCMAGCAAMPPLCAAGGWAAWLSGFSCSYTLDTLFKPLLKHDVLGVV